MTTSNTSGSLPLAVLSLSNSTMVHPLAEEPKLNFSSRKTKTNTLRKRKSRRLLKSTLSLSDTPSSFTWPRYISLKWTPANFFTYQNSNPYFRSVKLRLLPTPRPKRRTRMTTSQKSRKSMRMLRKRKTSLKRRKNMLSKRSLTRLGNNILFITKSCLKWRVFLMILNFWSFLTTEFDKR